MIDKQFTDGQDNSDIAEGIDTVTQLTLEDTEDKMPDFDDMIVSAEELEQDSVIINPDPDSMEARG